MQTEALKRLFDAFTAIESIERFIANSTSSNSVTD
jgi:hypothetical protein